MMTYEVLLDFGRVYDEQKVSYVFSEDADMFSHNSYK